MTPATRVPVCEVRLPLLTHVASLALQDSPSNVISKEYLERHIPLREPVNYAFGAAFFGDIVMCAQAQEVRISILRELAQDAPIRSELLLDRKKVDISFGHFLQVLVQIKGIPSLAPSGRWITGYIGNAVACATLVEGAYLLATAHPENTFRWPNQFIVSP